MRRRTFLAMPLFAASLAAQADTDYAAVRRGYLMRFPHDHGSHPDFRIEWWYITGWVTDVAGNNYGLQLTFFRNRPRIAGDNPSAFAPQQLIFAHAALTDPRHGRLYDDQRAARAGFGLAGADEKATRTWIDDWSLASVANGYTARISAREFAFDLQFAATQPVLPQGDDGYSRKGPVEGQASYYYSQPHLAVSGTLSVRGAAADVKGTAWLDHEWSSEPMAPEAVGWDWAGINLANGASLTAFRMRDKSGEVVWAGGSLRERDGRALVLAPKDVRFAVSRSWRSPRTGVEYPIMVRVKAGTMSITLEPLIDDQELDARATTGTLYWEGAVRAFAEGNEVGRGYLELTGYGTPLRL